MNGAEVGLHIEAWLDGELDASDRSFDVELAIQHRALGLTATEVPVLPPWSEAAGTREELAHALRACATSIGYRLHQLHVRQAVLLQAITWPSNSALESRRT